MMNQSWFEMADVRRRKFGTAVWIPLRAIHPMIEEGKRGNLGFRKDFFGAGSLAVPVGNKEKAIRLGWEDIGIMYGHRSGVDAGRYIPSDIHEEDPGEVFGIPLMLEQRINSAEHSVWHLHQDLVIALGLKREGNKWVCPDEDYTEVARLLCHDDGHPLLMEIRAEFLRDYLCARNMGLYITSYRGREEVIEDIGHIGWTATPLIQNTDGERWEGRITAIHEGGMPYGEETAVFHVSRTDVDPGEDIPVFGPENGENVSSRSWKFGQRGQKVYFIRGECWRNEWIGPGEYSPRVRRDRVPGRVFFLTDAAGKRESKETLVGTTRWLWFKPEVIPTLAHRRGAALGWYTRDTGHVRCSPDDKVHFGVNAIGLVNVFAKDIALLPEWQQQIWAGFNVSPEGGVSEELLASQMRAEPAETIAPEVLFVDAMATLDKTFQKKTGTPLFRSHPQCAELLRKIHRFRAPDRNGLFALAKDIARLTTDSLDTSALQKLVPPPKGEKWGSLKSLEKVLATKVSTDDAHAMMSPLFIAYELRLADAHLPSAEVDLALRSMGIDPSKSTIEHGAQLIYRCAQSLATVRSAFEPPAEPDPADTAP